MYGREGCTAIRRTPTNLPPPRLPRFPTFSPTVGFVVAADLFHFRFQQLGQPDVDPGPLVRWRRCGLSRFHLAAADLKSR
jgi:hypothetical protein